ncbi:MAG: AMP-binding protein [Lewinella sp.]|jgi:long-chain acyl-CoA synthetase|uniref:AMP-binding protein n=1 Tax=Lewinella sp. TaxID=2004506 RepID=UPI003D6B8665
MDKSKLSQNLDPIISLFYRWEKEQGDTVFLRQPYGKEWKELTYAEAGQQARCLCTALHELGLKPGDHVGILSKNCYHWIITDLALMMGNFVSVPFYASLPAEQLKEVIELSDIKALFVGKLDEWGEKAQVVPDTLKVIRFPHYAGNALIEIGHEWDVLINKYAPLVGTPLPALDDLWTILFTSGTTGTPKGVMHTYRNPALVLRIEELTNFTGALQLKRKKWFSFLPLNHVAERIAVEANCLANGGSISFAESIDTFANNLQSVQPSFIFAVPRIWTKFYQAVTAKIPAPVLSVLFRIPLLGKVLKNYLRKAMGLSHIEIAGTGAAITPAYLKRWYQELGIHLVEAYGMTEVCGSICNGPQADAPSDAVGVAVPFCEVKIMEASEEILMRAPYQMTGYYRSPQKTAEVIQNGWIHSGDRGTIDEKGYVRVIGRVKDAFKTSKGQFIIPNPLEEHLAQNEYLEQVCVVGLGCSQPIALVNLSPSGWNSSKKIVQDSLQETLNSINQQLANYHRVSTIVIDKVIWSEANRLLTPTMKVRRAALDQSYGEEYERWHSAKEAVVWK